LKVLKLARTLRRQAADPKTLLFDVVMATMVPWANGVGFQSTTGDGRLIGPFNPFLLNPAGASKLLDLQFVEQSQTSLSERVDADTASSPIIGRLVATGLHDELTGQTCTVIDGVDGRAHHVRFRGIDPFADAPPGGGIVEVRRFGGPDDQVVILAVGATWGVDYELYAHSAVARKAGISEDTIRTLAGGGLPDDLREHEKIAARVALQLSTRHVSMMASTVRPNKSSTGRVCSISPPSSAFITRCARR
jgi:Protein of unknown function (DUF3363)